MTESIEVRLQADQTEGTQATVAQWLKQPGEMVEENEPLVELETDKVMMEVTAPATGILEKIILDAGEAVTPEDILGTISKQAMSNTPNAQKKTDHSIVTPKEENQEVFVDPTAGTSNPPSNTVISPAVRRLTRIHNIDLNSIPGTGKNNRVTTRDVNHYLKQNSLQTQPTAASSPHSEIIAHSQMRKKIAQHMSHSMQEAPHVTSVFDMDMSAIIAHRNLNKSAFLERGVKLTFTTYFIAACVQAMQAEPKVNSRFHAHGLEVFNNINIGIGTALGDGGLIVPVIKNCEQHDLFHLSQQLGALTEKARNNQLSQADVKDGTFTISNHGVSGSLIASPIIINQPQTAILGIGKMEKRVLVKEIDGTEAIVIKPMCYVSLTIDHRALDAYQTNRFLTHFVEAIEQWPV